MSTQPNQRQDALRAVSRSLFTNHSRAVSRTVFTNHSRAVAAAWRG